MKSEHIKESSTNLLLFVRYQQQSTLAKTTTTTTTTSASIGPINFAVGNKQRSLAANDLREAWVVDYPWTSKIIEPHTDTTLEARGCDS